MSELFDTVNDDYPLIAYQSTLTVIFATWIVRLIVLACAEEKRAEPS